MTNPYLAQLCAQTGMSRWEASREVRRTARPITLEKARSQGFETIADYEEALAEFLNGQ